MTYLNKEILKLKNEIAMNNHQYIETFKKILEKQKTPLIETIEGNSEESMATFVYISEEEIENAVVLQGPMGLDYKNNQLERIGDTNIWFKSFKIRNDIRFSYFLTVNDPLNEDWAKRNKECIRPDIYSNRAPLVPKDPQSTKDPMLHNIVIMDNAPEKYWSVSKLQEDEKGTLKLINFSSKTLEDTYRVWIYVPKNYCNESKSKCVYFTDGFEYISGLHGHYILDNLHHESEISSTVGVFIESKDDRFDMLTCNKTFSDFIIKEIKPFIENEYNVSSLPEDNAICGLSLGGLFALDLALLEGNIFKNVISQSGSFWWSRDDEYKEKIGESYWMENKLNTLPFNKLNIYMEVGVAENKKMRDSNEKVFQVLQQKNHNIRFNYFPGGHDYLSWDLGLAEGLRFIFPHHKLK